MRRNDPGHRPKLPIRQEASIIRTQTVTWPSTTFTTKTTLSESTPPATRNLVANTAVSAFPSSTDSLVIPARPSDTQNLSQIQLGAILGGLAGFLVLVIIAWYCLSSEHRRRRRRSRRYSYRYDDGVVDGPEGERVPSQRPSRRGRPPPPPPAIPRPHLPRLNNPPRTWIPPTSRRESYRQTPWPQFSKVRVYHRG